jgi:hypothetical protein
MGKGPPEKNNPGPPNSAAQNAVQLVNQGQQIFRFDTFGDELNWVLAFLSKPLANSVDVQLATTYGYRKRPR